MRIPWRRVIAAITLAVVLFVVWIAFQIATFPAKLPAGAYDCAIVLGAAVSGASPSPVFQARIDHGIALHQGGVVRRLIFTGGVGEGDSAAEGDVAAAYAQQSSIPASSVLVDRTSGTTMENLIEAKKLMAAHGLKTAVIVSDQLHLRRSLTIAHWLGIDAVPSGAPQTRYRTWKTKLPFLLREVYFTIHFALTRQ